jgi:hypothetical protein
MAFSQSLAARTRDALQAMSTITEKRMFGGLGFFLHGNMLVGVMGDALIVRLGPEAATEALKEENVRPFDITGAPMKGWVVIDPDGLDSDAGLRGWIQKASGFVRTLPAKDAAAGAPSSGRSTRQALQ